MSVKHRTFKGGDCDFSGVLRGAERTELAKRRSSKTVLRYRYDREKKPLKWLNILFNVFIGEIMFSTRELV